MSLRKEKTALLKIRILEVTLKLVGKKPFEDLYVDDLCARVKISKVTFFKYFSKKEDLLLYYFRIWCLHRCVELSDKPREGVAGITYLCDKLSETFEEHPGVILSLLAYLADIKRTVKPFAVRVEEKKILYPNKKDISEIEILSLGQLLEKFALEAIFKKQITKSIVSKDLSNLLQTILFGSILTAHTNQLSPYKYYFRKNMELVLKGLE